MTTLEAKDPDVDAQYSIDARRLAYREMRREWPYGLGAITKAHHHTGYYYEATTPGETKRHWPTFPVAAGETVVDGSVVWTARHPDDSGLPTISAASWEIDPPAQLAVATHEIDGGIVQPTLTGGVAGTTYALTAHLTWSNGQQDDVTVSIPVAEL